MSADADEGLGRAALARTSSTASGGSSATGPRAHICNSCPSKPRCTDSNDGREIVRPLDPWPHSEAGRFHRVIALLLVALSALILLVEVARHHAPTETALLLALLAAIALAGRWLLRDLRVHPTNLPYPSGSHGLRLTIGASDAERQPR
jgi:hypothetical protein